VCVCVLLPQLRLYILQRQDALLVTHADSVKLTEDTSDMVVNEESSHTHTHTHPFNGPLSGTPGLPGWAGTRKVKPIWILMKQETVSGSGISWAICKSAPRSRQITMHPTAQFFYRPDALPAAQPTVSKH